MCTSDAGLEQSLVLFSFIFDKILFSVTTTPPPTTTPAPTTTPVPTTTVEGEPCNE